jgi:hypothetical protein
MKNWMGQDIQVGDVVYNARRDGNGTVNRLGRVISYNPAKSLFRVAWCVEPQRRVYNRETRLYEETEQTYRIKRENAERAWDRPSFGSNDVDALVKVEDCEAAAAVPPLDTLV